MACGVSGASQQRGQDSLYTSHSVPSYKVAGISEHIPEWIGNDGKNFKLLKGSVTNSSILDTSSAIPGLFIDAGCNHGFYSLYAAALGMRVECFEIQPQMLTYLAKSVEVNSFQSTMNIHNIGLSNVLSTQKVNFAEGMSSLGVQQNASDSNNPSDTFCKGDATGLLDQRARAILED